MEEYVEIEHLVDEPFPRAEFLSRANNLPSKHGLLGLANIQTCPHEHEIKTYYSHDTRQKLPFVIAFNLRKIYIHSAFEKGFSWIVCNCWNVFEIRIIIRVSFMSSNLNGISNDFRKILYYYSFETPFALLTILIPLCINSTSFCNYYPRIKIH